MFSCYCPCTSLLENLSSFWTTTLPHTHHFLLFYSKRKSDTGTRLHAGPDIAHYISYYCCAVLFTIEFNSIPFESRQFVLLVVPLFPKQRHDKWPQLYRRLCISSSQKGWSANKEMGVMISVSYLKTRHFNYLIFTFNYTLLFGAQYNTRWTEYSIDGSGQLLGMKSLGKVIKHTCELRTLVSMNLDVYTLGNILNQH